MMVLLLLPEYSLAELKPLDDDTMSSLTGQAGITIELETKIEIGEIAYKDAGHMLIRDIFLGGIGRSTLDNILMTIDVAGDGEVLNHGFSRVAEWADKGLIDSANADVQDAIAKYNQAGQYGKKFNSGDLVVHIDAVDPGVIGSNSSDQNLAAYTSSTDFELAIGSVELAKSDYSVGSGVTSGASMFSDISVQGYLGPTDIVIRNGSNTFSDTSNGKMSVSDAVMEIDANFRVTDLDMDWDNSDLLLIFNLAALKLRDMKIHNNRCLDSVGHFGFASASAKIAEGVSNITGNSGLAIYDANLTMDIDMPHVQFGSAPSIGEVYFTDFVIQADLLVYGH